MAVDMASLDYSWPSKDISELFTWSASFTRSHFWPWRSKDPHARYGHIEYPLLAVTSAMPIGSRRFRLTSPLLARVDAPCA